jgi:hypothetical protein
MPELVRIPAGVPLYLLPTGEVVGVQACRSCHATENLTGKPGYRLCRPCRNRRTHERESRRGVR